MISTCHHILAAIWCYRFEAVVVEEERGVVVAAPLMLDEVDTGHKLLVRSKSWINIAHFFSIEYFIVSFHECTLSILGNAVLARGWATDRVAWTRNGFGFDLTFWLIAVLHTRSMTQEAWDFKHPCKHWSDDCLPTAIMVDNHSLPCSK